MGYIYRIVDTQTHHYYIGKSAHKNPLTDNYWGSGANRVCRAAKKYNGKNGRYRKDVLVNGISCNIELGLFEKEIIGNLYEIDEYCLNLMGGGRGGIPSQATKDKIGAANKGKSRSQAAKDKMSAASKGVPKSQAAKDKMSAALKGNTRGRGGKGRVHSQATKDKMSVARTEYHRRRREEQQEISCR